MTGRLRDLADPWPDSAFDLNGLFFVLDMQRILKPDPTADLVNSRHIVYASRVDRRPAAPPFAEDLDELIAATRKPAVQKQAAKWVQRGRIQNRRAT